MGSWRTPLLLSVSPAHIDQVADTPLLVVQGENFIATPTVWIDGSQLATGDVRWIDPQHLELTLPGTLRPGAHSLTLANPGSISILLARAFTTGLNVFLPVLSR